MTDKAIIAVIKESAWHDGDVCARLKKVQRFAKFRGDKNVARCAKKLHRAATKLEH
jgi:hypothetical protein